MLLVARSGGQDRRGKISKPRHFDQMHCWEDLKEWVRQHEGLRPLSEAAKLQHYQIKREVKELWAGYKEIAEDLLKEQRELEQQVKEALPLYIAEEKQIAKGVPPEFHELYCPDPQLKENLIAELTRLDDSYSNRLRDLDRNCDRQASPGGWNDHDAALFEHILEQYPADLPDRRVLCFDRLKRTFPHKTLGQLMSYETWYQNNRFHKDRRKKCLEDWARERWSWLLRAVTEISQAQQSHAGHQLSRDEALRQKFKCEVLRQRLFYHGIPHLHWCAKIKDEVEKLAYQLNEEAERTERPIKRLSKVMYGSTCADMQVDVMGECLSSIKHVVGVRSVFLAKRLQAV
ncbi:coiled-coil domain-containing protein 148 [Trichonephila clavipes]|nr:coiled-coil domain-containing protein 148 [Trichonephila clavipes]